MRDATGEGVFDGDYGLYPEDRAGPGMANRKGMMRPLLRTVAAKAFAGMATVLYPLADRRARKVVVRKEKSGRGERIRTSGLYVPKNHLQP